MSSQRSRNKVLFLLSSLQLGGSEKKTVVKANELSEMGFDVTIAILGGPFEIIDLIHPSVKLEKFCRKNKFDLTPFLKLRKFVKENGIQVVWAVNNLPMLYARLALVLIKGVRFICSTNTTGFRNAKQTFLVKNLYNKIMNSADLVVYGSELQMEGFISDFRCKRDNAIVLHNGVDVNFFSTKQVEQESNEFKTRHGIGDENFVVGCVAKLRPEKNVTGLVMSFKELKQQINHAKLVIVGDGPELSDLQSLSEEFGIIEDVIFVGKVNDVRPYLSVMNAFVLNSTMVETFSNAALEAMSMGLAVILTDVGGAKEMISDDGVGLIIQPSNNEELLKSLLFFTEGKNCQDFSERAREHVIKEFSNERMLSEYSRIISET